VHDDVVITSIERVSQPVAVAQVHLTDRKSVLALRGVGPESEAESVRFPLAQSDKSGPGSQTRALN
jgi:hypothetical protein